MRRDIDRHMMQMLGSMRDGEAGATQRVAWVTNALRGCCMLMLHGRLVYFDARRRAMTIPLLQRRWRGCGKSAAYDDALSAVKLLFGAGHGSSMRLDANQCATPFRSSTGNGDHGVQPRPTAMLHLRLYYPNLLGMTSCPNTLNDTTARWPAR